MHALLLEVRLTRAWDPINRFDPAILFVPVQVRDLDFQHPLSWYFYV